MPRILEDIVQGIVAAERDMYVAGMCRTGAEPLQTLRTVEEMQADVIIVAGASAGDGSNYLYLLHRRPTLKIVAIAADGRSGFLHELRPHVAALRELSRTGLVAAIRGDSAADFEAIAQ